MTISYADRIDFVKPEQLDGFFVGWLQPPDAKTHLEILQRSYARWMAFDQGRCVGFINALSDGMLYAYIPLLEVLPEYQGQGIGAELVRRMLGTLENMYAIDIVCDESVASFYQALGFNRCVGMIERKSVHQAPMR